MPVNVGETEHLANIIGTLSQVAQEELDQQKLMQLVVDRMPELTGASGAFVEIADGDEMVCAAAIRTAAAHVGLRPKVAVKMTAKADRRQLTHQRRYQRLSLGAP